MSEALRVPSQAAPSRRLVVNADDFGRTRAINQGIIRAHEQGIVTSASMMVRWPDAAAAAAYAIRHPDLSLGLHVDLCEWVYREPDWEPRYEVVSLTDRDAVRAEISRQLERFRDLTGRDPTHVDSHQHVHRTEPVRTILREVARRLKVPLRHDSPGVRYCGAFFGQTARGEPLPEAIDVPGMLAILAALPPGITELACHPADEVDWESPYAEERLRELETLCDPRVRAALANGGIELCSFRAIQPERGTPSLPR